MHFVHRPRMLLTTGILLTMSVVIAACGASSTPLADDIDPAATTVAPSSTSAGGSAPAPSVTSDPTDGLDSIVAGQVVDGEPVQPRTATSGFKKVTVIAPAPASGTASFSFPAEVNVPSTTTTTIEGGCPPGWYVRPGQPGYFTQTSPEAAYSYSDPDSWIFHVAADDNVSVTVTPNPNGGNLFDRLEVAFYNSSMISSHHATLNFWCDYVPTFYSTASAADPEPAAPGTEAPPTTNAPATTDAPVTTGGVGSVPSNCYYCLMNADIVNLGTGLALDPSTGSPGLPVRVTNANNSGGQVWYLQGDTGGSVFEDGLATFGLWQFSTVLTTAVGMSGTTPTWASASASPPAGGQFYYVDRGAGQVNGTVQFISVNTQQCLASPASPGQGAIMLPCDTTDDTQWWTVTSAG